MERKKNFSPDGDTDETLVTPRFDRDEAETARPVVPLAVVSGEAETYDPPAAGRAYAPRISPRRSWPLALVLVSALAGGVLGGAGLYLFQKSRQESAAAPVEQPTDAGEQAVAPVAETTPEPSPTPAEGDASLNSELPEQVAELPVAVEETEDTKDADAKREESKREAEDAAPRERSAAESSVKRGKKGDREEEDNGGRESRPRRVADNYPPPSPSDDDEEDDDNYDRREARRVGSIVYGGDRRRERRRRRQPPVDRVRGIFEGQP